MTVALSAGQWQELSGTWSSGATQTSATLSIVDLNTFEQNNDFALGLVSFCP